MKPRTPEAERLEADYLARIRTALGEKGDEICRSVREHIEEAVSEFKGEEVTLVQMAQVIERLGPPEAYRESATGRAAGDPQAAVRLLDKLWVASLIKTIGLYIPIIDFYFCSLIGNVMMASVLKGELSPELRSVRRYAWVTAGLIVVAAPAALLSLYQPLAGLLMLPVGIGLTVVPLMLYWNLIAAVASMAPTIAPSLLGARRTYVGINIVLFALALVAGVVIAVVEQNPNSKNALTAAVGLALLPLGWILGTIFVLKPISRARQALS